MKLQAFDSGKDERRVLAGMATCKELLSVIAPVWGDGKFGSRYANLVGGWCLDYFRKYGKAPGPQVETYFDQWGMSCKDEDTKQLVEKFLRGVHGEYKNIRDESNPGHLTDLAQSHFDKVGLDDLAERIKGLNEDGKTNEAKEAYESFRPVNIGKGHTTKPFSDDALLRRTFAEAAEPLFRPPGALGDFFGPHLKRKSLIGFEGSDKSGKSFWLLEMAWLAMRNRLNVAFFEAGDLTEEDVMLRLAVRAAAHPQYAGTVGFPVGFNPDGSVKRDERHFEYGLDYTKSRAAFDKALKRSNGKDRMQISVHPSNTLSVDKIRGVLDDWKREDFVPSAVIVDYADILAPLRHKSEKRDQIDETWSSLRGLASEEDALVVTAAQTNAAAYKADLIGKENFSGSKTKNAHASGMVGINVTKDEEEDERCRLNWVVLRGGKKPPPVTVASCRALGRAHVISTF